MQNDIAQDVLFHYEHAEELQQENSQQSLESTEDSTKSTEQERAARKVRARGDTDRLLPTRRRDQDYFARDLVQVLDGECSSVYNLVVPASDKTFNRGREKGGRDSFQVVPSTTIPILENDVKSST